MCRIDVLPQSRFSYTDCQSQQIIIVAELLNVKFIFHNNFFRPSKILISIISLKLAQGLSSTNIKLSFNISARNFPHALADTFLLEVLNLMNTHHI